MQGYRCGSSMTTQASPPEWCGEAAPVDARPRKTSPVVLDKSGTGARSAHNGWQMRAIGDGGRRSRTGSPWTTLSRQSHHVQAALRSGLISRRASGQLSRCSRPRLTGSQVRGLRGRAGCRSVRSMIRRNHTCVATPVETMLGETAIAVHPDDEPTDLVGQLRSVPRT